MRMSDLITEEILRLISNSEINTAEIQRNELAAIIGCVPSQINYVLSSRFTPEHGFIIESRRGGGGYIRIKRVMMSQSSALMHIVNSVGDSIDSMSVRIVIENCLEAGLINSPSAALISAAVSPRVMQRVPVEVRDKLRAAIIKQMLMTLI